MTDKMRERFWLLGVGETLTIPWGDIPPTFGRPRDKAKIGALDRVFEITPGKDGLEVTRIQ